MSDDRLLAEAIVEAFRSARTADVALEIWADLHALDARERFRQLLEVVAARVIGEVLADRQREAARTGPWDAP